MRLTKANLEKRNVSFENGFFTCLICRCTWSINQKSEQIKQLKNCWICRHDPNHSRIEYEAHCQHLEDRKLQELDNILFQNKLDIQW